MVPAMRSACAAAVAFVRDVWPPIPIGMYVSAVAFAGTLPLLDGGRRASTSLAIWAVIVGALLLGYRWGWGLSLLIQLFWGGFSLVFFLVDPSLRLLAIAVLSSLSVALLYSRPVQRYLDGQKDRRARAKLAKRGVSA